ncbi:hypothetical protein COOONC_22193 [Cooperia oncophora]
MLILLPESLGFLVTKRRAVEAKKWIRRANGWGGSKFDCDVMKIIENETVRVPQETNLRESLHHVFHDRKLVRYMGIQTILWVVDFMVYNSLSLTATDAIFYKFQVIKGSADMSFLFSGLVELPCYFLMPVALDRLGRRPTVIISHLLSAASLLIIVLRLSADFHPTIYLCIWLIAKFGMASAFMCCFVYGAENFPRSISKHLLRILCYSEQHWGHDVTSLQYTGWHFQRDDVCHIRWFMCILWLYHDIPPGDEEFPPELPLK